MSSLGEWLNAMVELRRNKAQVAEFNAQQQSEGMSALGKGIGGFLGNLGERMTANQPTREDLAYNRMANLAAPPRATPVDPALASADPTLRPGQIPYDQIPITGQPFTGGKAGFAAMNVLDRQELAQARLAAQQQHYTDMNATTADKADIARQRLEETIRHHGETEEAKDLAQKNKLALDAMAQTNEKYQGDVKIAHAHNTGMTAALATAAGAKTQADWEKAVTVITGLYQAGTKQGFKDLPYPQIPPSPDQKAAAATAVTTAAGQDTWHWYNPASWANPSPADIAAQQKTAQQNVPTYGGPADYEMAPEPTPPSTRPQDYYPQGPGSPVAAPQGQPSQAGGAAPEGITVTNEQGVKMRKVNGKWVVVQ